MEKNQEHSQNEAVEKLYAFILKEMQAGAGIADITEKLINMGIDKSEAAYLAESVHTKIKETAKEEEFTPSSILPAVLGGGAASVISGAAWGFIVIATGYVIGFMAWGIGALCGYAVVLLSQGKKGLPLQIIAVASSILGIVIGKYVTFYHFLKEAITKQHGAEVASNLSYLSGDVVQFFMERITVVLGGFDVLWVILAIVSAWSIPKGMGIKLSR